VKLLEEARERATDVLSKHRAALDAVAEELIAHETVSGVRLAEISGQEAARPALVAATAVTIAD
jgi:ATP-dependent Zn protease